MILAPTPKTALKKFYLQCFLTTDKHYRNAYGMRFIDTDGVILDISFGQLRSIMKSSVKGIGRFHDFFKDLCEAGEERTFRIGRTRFESEVELYIRMPKCMATVPYTVTGYSMAVAEEDDIQVINYPNFTIRYKENCLLSKKKFGAGSAELMNAVTNFVYRTRLIERLCGFSVRMEFVKDYVRVVLYSYMNESDFTDRFVRGEIYRAMREFVGEYEWSKYWNKLIGVIKVSDTAPDTCFGINNVTFDISKAFLGIMNKRNDYVKLKGEHYIGIVFDGIVTKNGMISSYINEKRCMDVENMGHKIEMTKAPSMYPTDKLTPTTLAVNFEMYFKTAPRVVSSRIFYCNSHIRFDGYNWGKEALESIISDCEDYFEEYGNCYNLTPAMKICNTYSYIYLEYDISDNINGSIISQRYEMFKFVFEKNTEKAREDGIIDKSIRAKVVRSGKKVLVGLCIFNKEL